MSGRLASLIFVACIATGSLVVNRAYGSVLQRYACVAGQECAGVTQPCYNNQPTPLVCSFCNSELIELICKSSVGFCVSTGDFDCGSKYQGYCYQYVHYCSNASWVSAECKVPKCDAPPPP